jgi:hypothetical protein
LLRPLLKLSFKAIIMEMTAERQHYQTGAERREEYGEIEESILLIDREYDKFMMLRRSIGILSGQCEESPWLTEGPPNLKKLKSMYRKEKENLTKRVNETLAKIDSHEENYHDSIYTHEREFLMIAKNKSNLRLDTVNELFKIPPELSRLPRGLE